MKTQDLEDKVEETIKALKSSYKDKYSESDYAEFRVQSKKAKNLKHLVILVENMFDLDHTDAYDMVN